MESLTQTEVASGGAALEKAVIVAAVARARAASSDEPQPAGTARSIAPRVEQALAVLLDAYQYAQDLRLDPWDFAVELPTLRPLGLTNSDCRWLIGRGLVECGFELTLAGDERRSFRICRNLKLSKRSCFVLTEAGFALASGQVLDGLAEGAISSGSPLFDPDGKHPVSFPAVIAATNGDCRPTWDRDRQQLRVGKAIVKQFKVPAPNQEAVLAAFEEENWPPRIDDPLAPQPEQDPKRRLHDTINSLNRNQKRPLVRFLGDGSGQGVRWEFIANGRESTPAR